jgi:hypothetical protein
MKLSFLLPVLAMSVVPYVSAQEIRTSAATAPARDVGVDFPVVQRGSRPDTAPTREQTARTRRNGNVVWAVDMLPASILANIAADEFSIQGPNGKETLSLISSVPTVTVGADIACLDGALNLRLGGGMLLNGSVGTWLATGQAGFSMEIQRNVMFGPHIGLSYYAAPEWWGDTDITFDDTIGFLVGLHIAAGDRIAYLLSVDYMSMSFDVNSTGPGVVPNKNELDMSGLAVQFGLRVQF